MRYVMTIIWAVILGQVTGFLAGALIQTNYDPLSSLIYSVIFAVILFVLPLIMQHFELAEESAKK